MERKRVLSVSYKNDSGVGIPPHAVLQFANATEDIASGISILVTKPTGSGKQFFLDDGKGATNDAEGGKYGQCIRAVNGVFWAHYVSVYPPADGAEVGPVSGQWYVNETGSGFTYFGLHEPNNNRILVMQKLGGGGGAASIIFRVSATKATLPLSVESLIWTGSCDDSGAEYQVPESDLDGYGRLIILDVLGCFFNEPSAKLVGRAGMAMRYANLGILNPSGTGCGWVVYAMCNVGDCGDRNVEF